MNTEVMRRKDLTGTDAKILAVAEADADRACHPHEFSLGIDGLQLADGVLDRAARHLALGESDHAAEAALCDEFDGRHTETRGEDAVERRRRTAALDVPEDGNAHLAL